MFDTNISICMPCHQCRAPICAKCQARRTISVSGLWRGSAVEDDGTKEVERWGKTLDDADRTAELSRIEAGIVKKGCATGSFGEKMTSVVRSEGCRDCVPDGAKAGLEIRVLGTNGSILFVLLYLKGLPESRSKFLQCAFSQKSSIQSQILGGTLRNTMERLKLAS